MLEWCKRGCPSPSKPILMIVPLQAGTAVDNVARSPQQLEEAMRDGLARMGKIIREANIRSD